MRSFVFAATLGAAIAIKTETRQEVASMVIEAPEAIVLDAQPAPVLDKQEEPLFEILDNQPAPIIPDEEQIMILDPVVAPVMGNESDAYLDFHQEQEARTMVIENIDEVRADVSGWIEGTARAAIHEFANNVELAAWHDTESREGELLDTCAEGTMCRDKVMETYTTRIDEKWDKLIDQFKIDVETTIRTTTDLVETGFEEFQQCQRDHPCCDKSETVWKNLQIDINNIKKRITDKYADWDKYQEEIDHITNECPEEDYSVYRVDWQPLVKLDLDNYQLPIVM